MIRAKLAALVAAAVESARSRGELALDEIPAIALEAPKDQAHGDWSTSVAMTIARLTGRPANEVAALIVAGLPVGQGIVDGVEIAGPGFINLTVDHGWIASHLSAVLAADNDFGKSMAGRKRKVLVEFVSTNPNGPITVAGGRNAALGDSIASLLEVTGWDVTREYYINDALNSVQMINFGKSVLHRYKQLLGHRGIVDESVDEPDWLYSGDYVVDIARGIRDSEGHRFEDASPEDAHTIQAFRELSQRGMLEKQKADLEAFGVRFDNWFSEQTLHEDGRVQAAIDQLKAGGFTYDKDEAVWLRSTDFGDDKDRVLVRANGTPTYIAGDVAYHKDKFDRGFDVAIDIWGADHSGYVARTKAAVAELGYDPSRLEIVLYQLVRILKDGEFVKASKRRGDVLELKSDLIDEIGKDAGRFHYLTRSANTELDIDVEQAKRTERDNPVYYVQYAHARLCQAIGKAGGAAKDSPVDYAALKLPIEIDIVKKIAEYPDTVNSAADARAPHFVTQYLRDLAALVHGYYDQGNRDPELRIAGAEVSTTRARIALATAAATVLRLGLGLLGVDAPTQM